jgi:hypothetical protein
LEHLCLHGVCWKNLPPLGEMRLMSVVKSIRVVVSQGFLI